MSGDRPPALGVEPLRYVGVGPRAVATIIDAFLTFIVIGVPLLRAFGEKTTATTAGGETTTYSTGDPSLLLTWLVLAVGYYIVLEAVFGATVGKLLLNLRVRQLDGSRIGWKAAVIRNGSRLVDGFPYVIPYLVGALTIWSDEERQRLGDRPARTIVTYR